MNPSEALLERAIVEDLLARGWTEGSPADVVPELALLPEEFFAWLRSAHPAQWERFARAHGDALQERLVRALDEALRGGNTPDVLREGFTFEGESVELVCFPPPNALNPATVARAALNRLVVTRQAPIEPGSNKTVDLLLSLNGVPVATAELKHRGNQQSVEDAMRQYQARPTHLPIFRWPSRAVVHFAVDDFEAWMTTKVCGDATRFVPFNRGTEGGGAGNPPNPSGYPSDYLWRDVWARESFLSLLQRYVHLLELTVERDGRLELEKKLLFPRWHQRDAVRAMVADVEAKGPGQRYLVEHSAGSGKSNTIAWLAWHLADLHDLEGPLFDKVVVVTDRTVLDDQLSETIEQMTMTPEKVLHVRERVREERRARRSPLAPGEKVSGGRTLVDALDDPGARIVIVTVQTFLRAPDALDARPRRSFAVLLDEAHGGVGERTDQAMARTFADESGDGYLLKYASQRQHANQSLFAFTATPREETHFLFGTPVPGGGKEPFHRYRMRQAIEEGFVLDPRAGYIRYDAYFRLRGVGVDDPEVDQKSATAAVMREVSKDPAVMDAKCRVIVGHFLSKVRGQLQGEARAMVVAPSREAALRYHRALRATLDARGGRDVGVLVAFSGSLKDPGTGKTVTEEDVNGFPERELPRRFATGDWRVLVVANKYQTGFDQPLLSAMYIDRALEGVQAVQTLSRLNRPYPGKKVFALDFVNEAEVLDAFAKYLDGTRLTDAPTEDDLAALRDQLDGAAVYTDDEVQEVARLRLGASELTDAARQARTAGVTSVAVGRYLELAPSEQTAFRGALGEFVRLYALLAQVVLSPDASLEALAVYGRELLARLPAAGAPRALIDLRGRIAVEYYRLAPVGYAVAEGGAEGDGEYTRAAGDFVLGTRSAGSHVDPTVRLSMLLDRLNDRYGFGANTADRASLDALITSLSGDELVLEAVRAATDPRDLVRDAEVTKRIRRRLLERLREGDALAARFNEGDDDLRRELMEVVLEMVQRRASASTA